MQGVHILQHVLLLEHGDDLGLTAGVGHADGAQTAGQIVILGAVDGIQTAGSHDEGSGAQLFVHGLQDGGHVLHGVGRGVVKTGALHDSLVIDKVLGGGGILVGGDGVQTAADLTGIPVVGGDQVDQLGSVGLQQTGDVGEGAHGYVIVEGSVVGEHDVVGLVGGDDHVAAGIPVAPAHDLDVDVGADLLFQILVHVGLPGIIVAGHAGADGDPLQGGDLIGGGLGAGVLGAAAREQGSDHQDGQQKCENLLH